ncbi:MAG: hypothetical protein KW788_01980, partial [Candidatus Doudnabacteria bacterium]|nr:hypothetical protein [Candidatus Doudnabacteria bacterium]
RIKLTDMTGVLASVVSAKDDSNVLWNYMISHYPVKDLHVLEKVMFMKAAIEQTNSSDEVKFKYETNALSQDVVLKNGDSYSVTLSTSELASLKFSNVSGEIKVISYYEQTQDPSSLTRNSKLGIGRQYLINGLAATTFHEGDIIKIQLTPRMDPSALGGSYQIIDYLPSGLRPITEPYRYDGYYDYSNCIWYPQKIVDNKLYFTVYKGSQYYQCGSSFVYYARVVTTGSFTANPAIIQSVTNPDDLNLSESTKVNVK